LAFTFNSSTQNGDIWIYDLKNRTLSQATRSDRAGIPQSSFVVPQLIKYKTFDGRDIPAWYYISPIELNRPLSGRYNAVINGKTVMVRNMPVIVSVHGGPEGQERPGFNAMYQYYLSRGYAILATNVRG